MWTPSKMGKKGGATKGPSKVRGDSEYYKAIRAKRKAAPKTRNTTTGMGATPDKPALTQTPLVDKMES